VTPFRQHGHITVSIASAFASIPWGEYFGALISALHISPFFMDRGHVVVNCRFAAASRYPTSREGAMAYFLASPLHPMTTQTLLILHRPHLHTRFRAQEVSQLVSFLES